jgi:succinyl-CoA synthetase beta subunit
MFYLHEH